MRTMFWGGSKKVLECCWRINFFGRSQYLDKVKEATPNSIFPIFPQGLACAHFNFGHNLLLRVTVILELQIMLKDVFRQPTNDLDIEYIKIRI